MYSSTIQSGIDRLTSGQLERAAADLRNARLVVRHAGHFVGALVGRDDGGVCALGAIELATYKKLAYIGRPVMTYISLLTEPETSDAGLYRCKNAVVAFADFIPSALCPLCDDETLDKHAAECPSRTCTSRDPYDKITHYNDQHCVSGELLENMLGIAADRAMDAAQQRRSLLANRLSATV